MRCFEFFFCCRKLLGYSFTVKVNTVLLRNIQTVFRIFLRIISLAFTGLKKINCLKFQTEMFFTVYNALPNVYL